eukprot:1158355-Pelagomonas_calceolata.AAC.4
MARKSAFIQEGSKSITFGLHVQIQVEPIYSEFLLVIGTHTGHIREGCEGWVRGARLSGTPNVEYSIGFLSSSPVDWHSFNAIWGKGGSCVHDSRISATCARMWAAGHAETNMQQTNPSFQDSGNK